VNFDEANRERDRRLRRLLLESLEHAKRYFPGGLLDGVTTADTASGGLREAQRFEDEGHALSLLRDLENKGLVEIRPGVRRRGEREGLKHLTLKITARGTSLLNETLKDDRGRPLIDPDIDDDRVAAEGV
jgi:hypothetical protein